MPQSSQLEILDLRHFSGAQIAPLLRDEALRWNKRLHWDYTKSVNLLLDYLDSRVLPGFVALQSGRILGYAFSVFEGAKAVIGDLYAFHEGESLSNPVCETLLHHLIEMLQAAPGVDRVESQLLMFPSSALAGPFFLRDFRSYPRLFMGCDLAMSPLLQPATATVLPPNLRIVSWKPEFYDAAAALIHRAYQGHMDSGINDQYQTLHGAQRFLHNIIRFPGCGVFDVENSCVLRDHHTQAIEGVLLCSRVRADVGHITQLCLSTALRGMGFGTTLLRHCAAALHQERIAEISLTVTEANQGARHLYEKNGFVTRHRFEAMVWDKALRG